MTERDRYTVNTKYWHKKLAKTLERDKSNLAKLAENGWRVLTIWECETKNAPALADKLIRFINS